MLDLIGEANALARNLEERVKQDQFLRQLAANPVLTHQLVDLASQWGDHAPTLPAGAIMGLASAGIGPSHPVGQTVIRQGVPAMTQNPDAFRAALAAQQYTQPLAPLSSSDFLPQDPNIPAPVANLKPTTPISDALGSAASDVGSAISAVNAKIAPQHAGIADEYSQHIAPAVGGVLNAGNRPLESAASPNPQAAGFGDTSAGVGLVREAGAVANTGLQGLEIPPKLAMASVASLEGHPHGWDFTSPLTGHAVFHSGSIAQALDPGQLTLVQQARGKSLGTGFLPSGPAAVAATKAQQAAATVNGHALTYGRALASTVFEPGSRPYAVISGVTDGAVAMWLDPMANALKAGSEIHAANAVFAPLDEQTATNVAQYLVDNADTSEQVLGLHNAAGQPEADLVGALAENIKRDPAVAQNLATALEIGNNKGLLRAAVAHKSGVFSGLRPFVHPPTAIQWMASREGDAAINHLAADHSFSSIRSLLGDTVPVDVVAKLAHADTPELVRSVLSNELGPTVDGPFGYRWWRSPESMRLFSQMPKGSVDLTDGQNMVQQAERTFKLAGVPTDQADPILERIAGARTLGEAKDAYVNGVGDTIAAKLAQDGVPPQLAKKLTRFFPNQWEQQHMFNVDATGQTARAAGLAVDGEAVPIDGPHLETELARFVPPLDYRALRQASSNSRQLLKFWNDGYLTDPETFEGGVSRKLHQAASVESWVSGKVTSLFKMGVLSAPRVPLRVAGEEQLAMASAGIDSMFSHPMDYIATAIGRRATTNPLTGGSFADELMDSSSSYMRSLGRAAEQNSSPWKIDQQALKAYVTFSKGDPAYLRSWADELSGLHLSAPAREVARALADSTHVPAGVEGVQGLDAVKEWFANGAGQKYLGDLRDAKLPWGSEMLNNRSVSDAYINSVRDRIMVKTSGDPTLIQAVADGSPFDFKKANLGITKSVSHDFRQYLNQHIDDLGPDVVKGRPPLSAANRYSLDHAADIWLGKLMDTPTRVLTRSPAFKEFFYKEAQRLMPYMTEEAQTAAIENASADGMKLSRGTTTGLLEGSDANTIAQARSLARMKDYLYYPGDKTTAEDILRNVSPFAPAWKSVVQRWTKLSLEHPQILRRAQQGVQEMQNSGFTYKDPQSGKEVFSIAGPEWMKALTGASGFGMEGPVQGLNIVGNGLPGVGLGPQIAAAATIPKNGMTAALRNFISPYGDPDFSGGWSMFFPGWLQKMQAGQFQGVPLIGGALRTLMPRTPEQKVTVQDLQKQALTTMIASGQYDISKPGVLDQLEQRAIHQANSLYMWRGLAQFVAPTAPEYSSKVADPSTGTGIFLFKVAQDYRNILKADNFDSQKADLQFVAKYGPNLVYATEADNLRTVYGVPTTVKGEVWQAQHPSFVDQYPNVWGYFAPQDPTGLNFSQTVYHDQITKGLIQPLTVQQWALEADSHIGSAIYDQLRKTFGGHVTKADQKWLDVQKLGIAKKYPGYNTNIPGVGTKATQLQIVAELGRAIQDPIISRTPVAHAVGIYLGLRDQAMKAAGLKTLNGAKAAASRDWLYQQGNELVAQYPELSPIWDSVFQREVAP